MVPCNAPDWQAGLTRSERDGGKKGRKRRKEGSCPEFWLIYLALKVWKLKKSFLEFKETLLYLYWRLQAVY